MCIRDRGITPDYVVERTDDLPSVMLLEHEDDVQLSKAIEVLRTEMK